MNKRPNPEKLLARVTKEESSEQRGKLKIYLGAAPGVGKTHEMLENALAERRKGLDVVIGIVESHGRTEIDNFYQHFEILPRQKVEYRGKNLTEFDLNAALERNPGLILMDEMAHTNVPGLRHAKRWQDIKELLDRGINVYTTLNVQHIESLNNAASQIIHAPIHETIPDSMIEMADELELIDIPPEELLKRLEEGKVYYPTQAGLAKEHFFRKGNLIALRELALRITAECVSAQVLLYRQGEGIHHIWPTKEKILVCVGPGLQSVKLIRGAKRLATSLQAKWMAVYVDTPGLQAEEDKRNSAILNLRLAQQLGADTHVLTGFDIVRTVMDYAREQNVTQIMVWKTIRPRFRELLFHSLADEMVRHSGEIDVYIMTGLAEIQPTNQTIVVKNKTPWTFYLSALGIIAIATMVNFVLFPFFSGSNLVMVYLLAVTIIALFGKRSLATLASILCVLLYDFFFIPPYYSFAVINIEYLFTLMFMLTVALIISHLTVRSRQQAESSRFLEQQTASLHTLTRELANTRGIDNLLESSVKSLAEIFNCNVLALMPNNTPDKTGSLTVRASSTDKKDLDAKDQSVAQWVYDMDQIAGLGTDTLPFSDAFYLPMTAAKGTIGVLRIHPLEKNKLLSPQEMHLLEECAIQIARSLEADQFFKETK